MNPLTTPIDAAADPFALFEDWFAQAKTAEVNDPEAMTLATVDAFGAPDARIVLLKGHGPDGFTFYTNGDSAKGRQLAGDRRAALALHWKSLRRQVRVRGEVSPAGEAEADAYFASRHRQSRIGAWASAQSRPLKDRAELEAAFAATEAKYEGADPPRPPHWRGYRLVPTAIEFWADQPYRLHDRVLFSRPDAGVAWRVTRLFP
ncbi:MAG: pyridoxamine 5'-phosphate oxidase [Hyphomicrobiales bacterium]|nr:pyridoxamine 5'-phosphate oxidase [Hyphomicrobiales bacterium]MDE2017561.1 pyridoxamine 5'-phosphate oxidase [Hyphomicrobiales bacterium]